MTNFVENSILLSLNHVSVSYKRKSLGRRNSDRIQVLKNINFDVLRGESLGVIGKNGAGKSTLLRVMSGIIVPDKGHILSNCNKISLLSLQLGFDPYLTGFENAVMSGMLLGLPKTEVLANMGDIIEFSELGNSIYDPISTYSSGMRARLGFSVAFQLKPSILLIDEVLGVGDLSFKVKSSNAIRELISSDQTVVLVTHNGAQVKNLCDRAVWVEGGVIRMVGESGVVVDAYENETRSALV